MTDDIVTRLREIAQPGHWQSIGKWDKTANEAADEIERLRNELAISKQECQMAVDAVQDSQARLLDALRQLKGTQK